MQSAQAAHAAAGGAQLKHLNGGSCLRGSSKELCNSLVLASQACSVASDRLKTGRLPAQHQSAPYGGSAAPL